MQKTLGAQTIADNAQATHALQPLSSIAALWSFKTAAAV
jgi:hypothetical protein